MLRMMMAGLALMVATPAAAQTSELPVWLVGDWCMTPPDPKICIRYEIPEDGVLKATNITVEHGRATPGATSRTAFEGGILIKRNGEGIVVLREVSQGENELVMDAVNPSRDQARQVRYSVKYDVLTVEFILVDEPSVVQRYTREPGGIPGL